MWLAAVRGDTRARRGLRRVRQPAIRARCPEVNAAVGHVAGFARMIKDLSGDKNTLTSPPPGVDARQCTPEQASRPVLQDGPGSRHH
jgi:hypothetical protein